MNDDIWDRAKRMASGIPEVALEAALEAERAACARESERAAVAVSKIAEAHARLNELDSENSRLRLQLSESHLNARVNELVKECSRHEAEARRARDESRVARDAVQSLMRSGALPRVTASREEIEDMLKDISPEALYADGLDDAFLGAAEGWQGHGHAAVAAYDYDACVRIFMSQGMTHDEAEEWMEINVLGAYVGELTPIFIRTYKP
jgi:regulator of replication initiation timing